MRYLNPNALPLWFQSTAAADTVTSSVPSLDQTQFLTKVVYLNLLVTSRSCLTALHTGLGIFLSSLSCFVHVSTLPFAFGGFSVAGGCVKALPGWKSYRSPCLGCYTKQTKRILPYLIEEYFHSPGV